MTEGPQNRAKLQARAMGTERLYVGLSDGQAILAQGDTTNLEGSRLVEGKGYHPGWQTGLQLEFCKNTSLSGQAVGHK